MKSKNIKEFKALIKRYESITLEEIKKFDPINPINGSNVANNLTGFGFRSSCTLCRILEGCDGCIWLRSSQFSYSYICACYPNAESYNRISNANTHKKLLIAFRNRAKHMRKLLIKLRIKQP